MRKKLVFLLSLMTLLCKGQQYSQKWADVNYVGDGKSYHALDIYLPKVSKTKYPVVVLIYGSAWQSNSGKSSDMTTLGAALLDAGYAIVSPNHRSSSDAIYPAQIQDIKAVVRFVRGASATYKFDTCFIGMTGSSSGGHLSALCGTTNKVKNYTVDGLTMDIEGSLGTYTSFSSSVHAVCDWFGPTDFLIMDSCGGSSITHNATDSPESKLVGGAIQNNKSKCKLANPITYVDPTDPPYLIVHGDADALVPYCESYFLDKALKAKGVQSQYILVPGGQHYTNTHTTANITKMVAFFDGIKANTCAGTTPTSITVTVTSPANNATFEAPATVSLAATASTTSGTIAKVEFYQEATKLGEDASSPYTFSWPGVAAGTYSITAVATDNSGKTTTSTAVSITVTNPPLKIYKTSMPITIDGTIDAVWTNTSVVGVTAANVVQGTVSSATDLSVTYKTLWDDSYLYILADVTDDTKTNDSQNSYDDDAVEVYIDINNNKATSYGSNDRQFSFGWNDGTSISVIPSGSSTTGISYSAVTRTGGYIVEARIPWSVVSATPAINQLVGIDFMVNDDDDGGNRDGKLAWNSTTDNAYQNPSLFGTGKLMDVIMQCPDAPVVTATVTYSQGATATALTATGSNLLWYTSATGGTGSATAPIPSTATVGTTSFYVSQSIGGCESSRSKIDVVIIPSTTVKIDMKPGWNLVGYPFDGSSDIASALASIWTNVLTVKDLTSFYDKSQPAAFNSLIKLNWGQGYLVKVDKSCELIWNNK